MFLFDEANDDDDDDDDDDVDFLSFFDQMSAHLTQKWP